jgi:hypothetical protein
MFVKNRIHHWSCGKFADWIRGEEKPVALTLEEWDEWRNEQRTKRPIRFYISDTLLTKAQDIIFFPCDVYRNIRCYFRNRFRDKIHCLNTGLKPGNYYDLDHRILHGLFNELTNFVESELAWMNQLSKKQKRLRERSPKDGVEYLEWASDLTFNEDDYGIEKGEESYGKPTPQAESSKEILELYKWWKNYPNRPNPMDASGWSDVCETKNPDPELKKQAFEKLNQLEEEQDQEETDMLIRLIKVRKSLWT